MSVKVYPKLARTLTGISQGQDQSLSQGHFSVEGFSQSDFVFLYGIVPVACGEEM